MSSGCKFQEVEARDTAKLNSGNVSESLEQRSLLVIDDQRTTSLNITPVPQFTLTSTNLFGVDDLLDIGISVQSLQKSDGGLGLLQINDGFVRDDQRNLGDLFDSMSSGENKGSRSSGGKR